MRILFHVFCYLVLHVTGQMESTELGLRKIELCLHRCGRYLIKRHEPKARKLGNRRLSSALIGVADVCSNVICTEMKLPDMHN